MPQALDRFLKATADLREAHALIEMIGKPSPGTTLRMDGVLRGCSVTLTVCYQEHDGGKNYHECSALDRAMSMSLRRHYFDRVMHGALRELERAVSDAREAAAAEYQQIFSEALAAGGGRGA